MRRLLQNKSTVASLVAVAALCIAANFVKDLKRPTSPVAARVAPETDAASIPACPIRTPLRVTKALSDWQSAALLQELPARDPFRRVLGRAANPTNAVVRLSTATLTVQAISIEADRALAVINRRVLAQGESIDGYRVDRIQPTQVWLSGPAGTMVLPVQPANRRLENVPTGK